MMSLDVLTPAYLRVWILRQAVREAMRPLSDYMCLRQTWGISTRHVLCPTNFKLTSRHTYDHQNHPTRHINRDRSPQLQSRPETGALRSVQTSFSPDTNYRQDFVF